VKVETWIFAAGALFFAPIAVIYGVVTSWDEPVGAVAITLVAGLSALIAGYFYLLSRRIDPRPEDNPYGEIAEGAGELGMFAPYSWWPLWTALAAAALFLGMAVGLWMMAVAAPLAALAAIGWVMEYYRGAHAH
jgi:uncharacterized membrane protein